MDTPEHYDVVRRVTRKVGGEDVKRTMDRLFREIQALCNAAGRDGVVIIDMTAHVPARRLNP